MLCSTKLGQFQIQACIKGKTLPLELLGRLSNNNGAEQHPNTSEEHHAQIGKSELYNKEIQHLTSSGVLRATFDRSRMFKSTRSLSKHKVNIRWCAVHGHPLHSAHLSQQHLILMELCFRALRTCRKPRINVSGGEIGSK